jgi:hypothetical protein
VRRRHKNPIPITVRSHRQGSFPARFSRPALILAIP